MALEHESESAIARAVRTAPSQSAFARRLKRPDGRSVAQSTVSEWLKAGRAAVEYVPQIEEVSGVSRHDLAPDIFGPPPALLDSPADVERAR